MRKLNRMLFAALLAVAPTGAALAQSEFTTPVLRDPEQLREHIERLYRLEQAFLTCDHVRVSGADLKRLDSAIAELELVSGLPSAELEAIYEQVEIAAVAESAFCAEMPEATRDIQSVSISEQR